MKICSELSRQVIWRNRFIFISVVAVEGVMPTYQHSLFGRLDVIVESIH
ncbi:hypothetical protein X975_11541, partial [Stegodyphus mimosarum]